jgi:hypothetical protein
MTSTGQSFGTVSPWLIFPAFDGSGNAYEWSDFVSGDFNGDGKIDYAAHDLRTGHEWVAINNGSSYTLSDWTAPGNPWAVLPNITWVDFVVGDFNGDGRADIAARVLQNGNVFVAASTGSGFSILFWDHWAIPSDIGGQPITWVNVLAGDFNGDGKTDIVARDLQRGNVFVAVSNGAGAFTQVFWQHWAPSVTWADVQVANFDGTGHANLFARVGSVITQVNGAPPLDSVWISSGFNTNPNLNDANQHFWEQWSTAVIWTNVQVGNFDGSGKPQVLARAVTTTGGSPVNTVWLSGAYDPTRNYTANPTGQTFLQQWASALNFPGHQVNWTDVVVGDFNGDGISDIAARIEIDGSLGEWFVSDSKKPNFQQTFWNAVWDPRLTFTNDKVASVV